MIAKLVTHGPDRLSAIHAQAKALDEFAIDGIRHNIPFLASLMRHGRWQAGRLSTGFIAEEYPDGFAFVQPKGGTALAMMAVAAHVDHVMNQRKRQISGQLRAQRPVTFHTERTVVLGADSYEVALKPMPDGLMLRLDTAAPQNLMLVSDWVPGAPVWRGLVGAQAVAMQVRQMLNGIELGHAGFKLAARVYTRREAALAALMPEKKAPDTSKKLLCPMPGLVKAIYVAIGQEVKVGEPLCMVEAMKMENVLRAERDCTVKAILAVAGASMAVDAVIMEFA